VARERDEESGALHFGSSRGGTASATEFTGDTFQTSSRMRRSARRLQYDGPIPKPPADTIAYMAHYLDQFHRMKGIFLEFRVTKRTLAKVDEQWREIRHQ